MLRKRAHLSADELLRAADRELSPRRLACARRHLAQCASCTARLRSIESTLADAVEVCREEPPAEPLPPVSPSRARLELGLAALSRQQRPATTPWIGRWALSGGALAAVAFVSVQLLSGSRPTQRVSSMLRSESGIFLLPRADLTPGMARPVTVGEVCGASRHGRMRAVPDAVHESVFERYGADYHRSTEYELDYLITPELGGTEDPRNLWPQPYAHTPWNAYVKDELELHLHGLVCGGRLDFATAQREMATDWIAAYKRYFKTDKPLRDYATSPLTARDVERLLSELDELGISPEPSHRQVRAIRGSVGGAGLDFSEAS